MAKSYLITGGAGFIGLTFTKLMLKETEARITVLDKLTYASHPDEMETLKENSRFRFIKGDISVQEDIDRAFDENYDGVIHFARNRMWTEAFPKRSRLSPLMSWGHIAWRKRSCGKSQEADSYFNR